MKYCDHENPVIAVLVCICAMSIHALGRRWHVILCVLEHCQRDFGQFCTDCMDGGNVNHCTGSTTDIRMDLLV